MSLKKPFKLLATIALILLPIVGFLQRQEIFDWMRLRNYQPPFAVVKLANDTTMNDDMRRLFYVYRPSIEDKATFNKSCRDNEQTIVLGCYVDRVSIHLLDVTDSRLAGVEEVTAAHESLHAAYNRLSGAERKNVDRMTSAAFAGLTNERIKNTIELYRKQNPSIVPNELHSILGTEVRNLPIELENYYKRYFTNRSVIVAFSEQYEQAFTDRKNQIKAYDAELASLKSQIEILQADLDQLATSLSTQRASLDGLRSAGNIPEYNSGVENYNRDVVVYNNKVDRLTSLVAKFNGIVPIRNDIASEEQELVKAIDSRETVPARR